MSRRRASTAPLGSAILGEPAEPVRRQRIRIQMLLTLSLLSTHLLGALVAAVLINVVIPGPSVLTRDFVVAVAVIAPVYILIAMIVGTIRGTRLVLEQLRWALDDQQPNDKQKRDALRLPWRLTVQQGALWSIGFVLFTVTFGIIDPSTIPKVSLTIALAGLTVCGFLYLFGEFALRPIAARALEAGAPARRRLASVEGRFMIAWLLGSGIPIIGLLLIAVFSFVRPVTPTQFAVTTLTIGTIGLVVGALLMWLNVRASVAPIESVRFGMARIEQGHLDARVVVYDGTALGELQAGFNRMAEGLTERERLRDVFGRHVGRDVAAAALANADALGGVEQDVAVLFVDIIGSTAMAASRPPAEVVALLNMFFDVVVDEVHRAGGFINKFEGDAALAIFGAPVESADAADCALRAAREIGRRIVAEVPECRAGIGVASGRAVAGNIGARERFEYTVIGDPVNEAARLSDLAKTIPGRVAASGRAVTAASDSEAALWASKSEVALRGRTEPTIVHVPREAF
ncbi:MAG: adenylate/guanylate cyclase domain-containing protein [Rhodococcus sp. (in: high G+C Gram-positive bacteria)]|uniref:adenylate/guanylate cyclase domain-containing protein n=1 Tax=Rhodococcus sp. TaxID=1831 RepID=UPI003BB6152D